MTPHRMERREINTASTLQIYLHDINDTPLLSARRRENWPKKWAWATLSRASTWSRPISGWW